MLVGACCTSVGHSDKRMMLLVAPLSWTNLRRELFFFAFTLSTFFFRCSVIAHELHQVMNEHELNKMCRLRSCWYYWSHPSSRNALRSFKLSHSVSVAVSQRSRYQPNSGCYDCVTESICEGFSLATTFDSEALEVWRRACLERHHMSFCLLHS